MPPAGGVTGWAALRWCGGAWFDGRSPDGRQLLPVALASCQDDIREQAGMALCQERFNPAEVVAVDGLRVTVPGAFGVLRDAVCRKRARSRRPLRHGGVQRPRVDCRGGDVCAGPSRWTGFPRHAGALDLGGREQLVALGDKDAHDLGPGRATPTPLCNRPIFDLRGRHIGTPDLFDPEKGVAGEFDGTRAPLGRQRVKQTSAAKTGSAVMVSSTSHVLAGRHRMTGRWSRSACSTRASAHPTCPESRRSVDADTTSLVAPRAIPSSNAGLSTGRARELALRQRREGAHDRTYSDG